MKIHASNALPWLPTQELLPRLNFVKMLVCFGYPKGLEEAPRVGVRAGLGILEAVVHANAGWIARSKTAIDEGPSFTKKLIAV